MGLGPTGRKRPSRLRGNHLGFAHSSSKYLSPFSCGSRGNKHKERREAPPHPSGGCSWLETRAWGVPLSSRGWGGSRAMMGLEKSGAGSRLPGTEGLQGEVAPLCTVPSPHGHPGISGTCCVPGQAPDWHPLSLCVPAPGRKQQRHLVAQQPCPAPSCLWPHQTQPPSREAFGCRAGAGRTKPVAGGTQEPWLRLCSRHACGQLTLQQGSGPKSLAHQVLSPDRAVDSFPLHPGTFWQEPPGPHPGAATPAPPATPSHKKVQNSSGPSHNFLELRDRQRLGLGPRW
ncbi:uncharacterized protein LOC100455590 [Pongo abelii]|uniref:uncharacterized protein LOC100455590 n=1 Tax=Pongo abelii TaxID=9601 RepID=UPI0023E8D8AD|nr:uncharacterized protein LOC100455590 [Pongo abelii]